MKKIKTQTMKVTRRFCGMLCIVVLAAFALFAACERKTDGPLTDVDGNQYSTVKIGDQVWMSQDLKVTHLPDGSALSTYDILIEKPAYFIFSGKVYYNAAAAQNGTLETGTTTQGICPDGWHLPTSNEWQTLVSYLANHPSLWDSSGSVSKALADKSWRVEGENLGNEPERFNQTGFSALPTGFVHDYPLHAGGQWEHWKEHGSAIYWCADFNNDYPKPAPVIDTANISPDPYPAWNYGWPDSIYPQPYIFEMNIHSDPSISSLADLHFCAVRCVKN